MKNEKAGSLAHAVRLKEEYDKAYSDRVYYAIYKKKRDDACDPEDQYEPDPVTVMQFLEGEEERIVYLLKGLVGGSDGWTLERLRDEGFSETIIEALNAPFCKEKEDLDDYERRLTENPIARKITELDMLCLKAQVLMIDLGDGEHERLRAIAEAHYYVGCSYYTGENELPKDLERAVEWFRKAAELGVVACPPKRVPGAVRKLVGFGSRGEFSHERQTVQRRADHRNTEGT